MPRRVDQSARFGRNYKRETRGRHAKDFRRILSYVVNLLINDSVLPRKYNDHPLHGKYKNTRDCHLKPDLVLIYSKPDADTLILERLDSHSKLSLSWQKTGNYTLSYRLQKPSLTICV